MNSKNAAVAGAVSAAIAMIVLAGFALVEAGPFAPSNESQPSQPSASPSPRDPGPVIATADGAPIYLGEIESRVEGMASMHGDLEDSLGEDWPDDLLQNVVDDKIVEREAEEQGIVVTEEDVDVAIEDLRGFFSSEADFEAWLAEGLMDIFELRGRIKMQQLAAGVFAKVTDDVTVTVDEARTWFEQHPEKYPGQDGQGVPFYVVRDEIRGDLLAKKREAAYGEWLEGARGSVNVVVVLDAWWEEIA